MYNKFKKLYAEEKVSLVFKLQPHPCFHFSFWSSVILFYFFSESSLFNPLTSLCWELGSVGSWSNSLEPCHPCLMALRWQQLPRSTGIDRRICARICLQAAYPSWQVLPMPARGLCFLAGPSVGLIGTSWMQLPHTLQEQHLHWGWPCISLRSLYFVKKKTAHSGKTALVIEKLFFLIKQ